MATQNVVDGKVVDLSEDEKDIKIKELELQVLKLEQAKKKSDDNLEEVMVVLRTLPSTPPGFRDQPIDRLKWTQSFIKEQWADSQALMRMIRHAQMLEGELQKTQRILNTRTELINQMRTRLNTIRKASGLSEEGELPLLAKVPEIESDIRHGSLTL